MQVQSSTDGQQADWMDKVGKWVFLIPRVLLLCLLAVLGVALLGVVVRGGYDLYHLLYGLFTLNNEDWSLTVFALVEKFSIAIVLLTIIVGGWHNYIRPFPNNGILPWLQHTGPYYLKAAICYSLAGVSAVGLLVAFVDLISPTPHVTWLDVLLGIAIHFTFMFSGWIHQRESKKETC